MKSYGITYILTNDKGEKLPIKDAVAYLNAEKEPDLLTAFEYIARREEKNLRGANELVITVCGASEATGRSYPLNRIALNELWYKLNFWEIKASKLIFNGFAIDGRELSNGELIGARIARSSSQPSEIEEHANKVLEMIHDNDDLIEVKEFLEKQGYDVVINRQA